MTDDTNRKTAEDYMNAWSRADKARLEAILEPGFRFNNPPPGYTPDKQGAIEMAADYHTGFPDLRVRYTDWLVQGDKVCVRFAGSGTHKGTFMGVPPTGKAVETTGLALLTVRNGKIANDITEFDALGLLTQIGAIPPLGQGSDAPEGITTSRPSRTQEHAGRPKVAEPPR